MCKIVITSASNCSRKWMFLDRASTFIDLKIEKNMHVRANSPIV